jgi:ankyrin repeat protein
MFELTASGDLSQLEFSLAHGAPVEVTDAHGNTLLHQAAKFGQPTLVQFLSARGLSVNKLNQFGESPLHLAVSTKTHRSIEVVQVLIALNSDSSTPSSLGDSPVRKQ